MPSPTFHLLVLEDEQTEIERLQRNVQEYNQSADSPIKLSITAVKSTSEAIETFSSQYVDCAMLDLRVPNTGDETGDERHGNAAIREVVSNHAVPVLIHSGHTRELSEEFDNLPFKILVKDTDSHQEAFKWLAEQAPLMNAMRETRSRLNIETARIFYKSVWPQWQDGQTHALKEEALFHVVSRQVVAFLAETLSLPGVEVDKFHLHEFYFVPPIRDRLHTGDITRLDGNVCVVVTPQCNIARDYPDNILLAPCTDLSENWQELKDAIVKNDGKPSRKITDKVKGWANQNVESSLHFLPPCAEEGPWIVNFKNVISVPNERVEELIDHRIASITPQFIPNLIQRWASYLGRVGQPELSTEDLITHIAAQ